MDQGVLERLVRGARDFGVVQTRGSLGEVRPSDPFRSAARKTRPEKCRDLRRIGQIVVQHVVETAE